VKRTRWFEEGDKIELFSYTQRENDFRRTAIKFKKISISKSMKSGNHQ